MQSEFAEQPQSRKRSPMSGMISTRERLLNISAIADSTSRLDALSKGRHPLGRGGAERARLDRVGLKGGLCPGWGLGFG